MGVALERRRSVRNKNRPELARSAELRRRGIRKERGGKILLALLGIDNNYFLCANLE
tara:strand:- start:105 stop:275 length:171 start_codon:yes stop_codon:yes gene_type:complete